MEESDTRIGVLRGRENSFPDAFIEKVNEMGKAHFPWVVEKMASYAVERALSDEHTPKVPDWKALLLK